MSPERKLRVVHGIYAAIILALLGIIAAQITPSLFERTIEIPDESGIGRYTLRMLASGDLVFEAHRFLPLASYRDYWGDMEVSGVHWMGDRTVELTMGDGARLRVVLGSIELLQPRNR